MAKVNIKIEGISYRVEEGKTILEAAKTCGYEIPSLCAFNHGECNNGSCRVCLVEVTGARGLVAACVYPVSEGMEAEEIFKAMSEEFTPIFIFISELDQFINTIYKSEYDMKGFVENVFSKGQNNNIYFFADLSIRNKASAGGYPAFESFIGYRKGVHVGGKTVGNTILNFDYIPYNERGKAERAGLATLPEVYDEKETSRVVIPLVKKTGKEEISK